MVKNKKIKDVSASGLKALVKELRADRKVFERKQGKLKEREEELKNLLEKVSKLTAKEARKILLSEIEKELKAEKAKKIRVYEEQIKQTASEKARELLIEAMRHGATEYVAEYTLSSVKVPSEDVKGRVIGKEGRNIRAFEKATKVELELDETNEIKLSSYDSIRREIAKRSLEKLIKDARIQPSKIEEVVEQAKKNMEKVLIEEGKKIAEECGVYNLPTEIVSLIGRYKFRTSYGQNLGIHTIEVTKVGVSISNEIGADSDTVRLACLLHDIGKVVTEDEGTHVELGVKVLKKHGFPKEVVNAVSEHHEDKPFSSLESVIVWIADAISGSRPGARYEPHEGYVERMEKIEEIAQSFDGVETAYAFQAGRDVRVIVNPEEIDDDGLTVLVHDITKKLEKEAEYAGQVKVTAIREIRAMGTTAAK